MASIGLTAFSTVAEEPIRPEYLEMSQQERAEYVADIQSFDYGILIESDSADFSQYYSGGAYAATTVMGWAGMSTAGTYGAYYALEWVGYIISESLERAGKNKEAAYFPHSKQFDIDLDYSNTDPNGDFGNNTLYVLDHITEGGSTAVMEVVADATASMGHSMYTGFQSNVLTMYYIYDDLREDTVEGTAENIVCKVNVPGMPCNSNNQDAAPYTYIGKNKHGYDDFNTMFIGNPSSKYYLQTYPRNTYKINSYAAGGFTNFPRLDSGNGNDYIFGSDYAEAGRGNDTLIDVKNAYGDKSSFGEGNGQDVIVRATNGYGGDGNDSLIENVNARGQGGDDLITDSVNAYGGDGNDNLWSNERNYGQAGDDKLIGSNAQFEWHWGGEGNDIIQGNAGSDEIYGGTGYDLLSEVVKEGNYNLVDGGADEDSLRLVLKNKENIYVYLLNSAMMNVNLAEFDFAIMENDPAGTGPVMPLVTVKDVETLLFDDQSDVAFEADFTGLPLAITYEGNELNNTVRGGENHDLIRGEKGRDKLYGGNGNDTLDGGSWPDKLFGQAGHDTIFPGLGDDYVNGGSGTDTVSYANLPDEITANMANGQVHQISNNRTDTLVNIENLIATDFDDSIWGNSQDNLLVGGLGDDVIDGGAGDDTLIAVEGDDQLTGGEGADIFELAHFKSTVQITDYNHAEGDVIQLDVHALGIPVDEDGVAIISSYGGTQGGRYHAIYLDYHAKAVQLVIPSGNSRYIATLPDDHDFKVSQIKFINRDPALLYKTEAEPFIENSDVVSPFQNQTNEREFTKAHSLLKVSFKDYYNKYFVAEGNGGQTVNANRTAIGPWETFAMFKKGNGCMVDGDQVHVRTGNGKYWQAKPDADLNAKGTAANSWETFTLKNHDDTINCLANGDMISLKGAHNNWVNSQFRGNGSAYASTSFPTHEAKFTVKVH